MISDWHLFAVAEHVRQTHQADARTFIAERIGALALAGDIDGVAVWRAVAARYEQLSVSPDATFN